MIVVLRSPNGMAGSCDGWEESPPLLPSTPGSQAEEALPCLLLQRIPSSRPNQTLHQYCRGWK